MIAVEDLLWVTLAVATALVLGASWQSVLLLSISVASLGVSPAQFSSVISMNEKGSMETTEIGLQMSCVMIPVLLQILAFHYGGNDSQWTDYSKIAALLVIPQKSVSVVLCAIACALDPDLDKVTATFFMVTWFLLLPMAAPNFSKSFTFGEFRVVSLLLVVVGAEYTKAVYKRTYEFDYTGAASLYPLVALAGSIACLGFACLGNSVRMPSWWLKLALNIMGPLAAVDLSLLMATNFNSSYNFVPLSLQWLVEFLVEKENGLERFWGLVYWIIVLAVGSYPTYSLLSIPSKKGISVVVTRKWFHLIAVLLFGPTTWQFPQLMSLSYAIASCVLIVLETLRRDAPILQSFYTTFLDDRKDDGGQIIVSHIFLIVGCAAPLWVSEILSNRVPESSPSLLVTEFGVLCIGIGDAMGAVVGKTLGKHKWGKNQRTLEGSLAMWTSMVVFGVFLCASIRDFVALSIATTFTAILEAFTVQLDNLVLPIIGTSIILLILTP